MKQDPNGIDGTLCSRYECKYLVPERVARDMRGFLKPFVQQDAFARQMPEGRYEISSLYLDTPDLRLYRQTQEGAKNRFKLRLRTYSDEPDDPVFFEIKRRIDGVVHKQRSRLDRARTFDFLEAQAHLRPRNPVAHSADIEDFSRLAHLSDARPAMRIKYQREAYESTCSDPVRITFDTHLEHAVTTAPNLDHGGGGWHTTPLAGVIVEVKFTDVFPSWVRIFIDRFEMQRTSVAKYALSMENSLDRGRCSMLTFQNGVIGSGGRR